MIKKLIILLGLFIPIVGFSQGAEMITNGGFTDASNWGVAGGWAIGSGVASYDNAGGNSFLTQTDANMVSSLEASTLYTLEFDIVSTGASRFGLYTASAEEIDAEIDVITGHYVIEFTSPSGIGSGGIAFYGRNTYDDFTIDNISLVKNVTIGDDPYYVATDGNDAASGDIDHPWATWAKAFRTAEAGDTVYFRGGTWYKPVNGEINMNFDTRDGTANSGDVPNGRICFFAYPPDLAGGDSVIYDLSNYIPDEPDYAQVELDNSGHTYNTGLELWLVDSIHIKNIVIRNAWQTYRYVYTQGFVMYACKNNIIENVRVENIGGIGFRHDTEDDLGRDVDSTYFINCDAIHCVDSLSTNYSYYQQVKAGTWAHGFNVILMKPADYVEYKGCRAWECADDGWNSQGYGTSRYDSCWSFSNGIYLPFQSDFTSGNGYKMNTPNQEAYLTARYLAYPELIAHYMTNSIAAWNNGYGMTENRALAIAQNRKIYNNIAYGNEVGFTASGADLAPEYDDGRDNAYVNNASHNNRTLAVNGEDDMATNEYNTWNAATGVTTTDADFFIADSSTMVAQLKGTRAADGSLPTLTYLHLQASSDLIDAGTDVGITYYGDAPDIGAFEWSPPLVKKIYTIGGVKQIYWIDSTPYIITVNE